MYESDLQDLRKLSLRDLCHPCGAVTRERGTKQPRAQLDRWGILRDLVVDAWLNPDDPPEGIARRHLEALSPIERDLVWKMFLNVGRILPRPQGVEIDVEGTSRYYDRVEDGVATSVFISWTFSHPDGTREHFRLKTGRSGTTEEEAALLWLEAEAGESFHDIMAWTGEVTDINPPPSLEDRLIAVIRASPALSDPRPQPGYYCVRCDRAARCGAYPTGDGERAPSYARTLNLTKTDLIDLALCQRRVAWRRVHGIPYDDGDDPTETDELSRGIEFHRLLTVAHEGGDPAGKVEDFLRALPVSEVADFRQMWDNHLTLLQTEGLEVRRTEFPVGITLLQGEKQELRGATLIGFVDLTARDPHGHPAAVEVKTGTSLVSEVENDLYALGMRRWLPSGEPVVIHRHHVRRNPPECERFEYTDSDLVEAMSRLEERISPALGWDWDDPLQPPYQVGGWCQSCRHRGICSAYRS